MRSWYEARGKGRKLAVQGAWHENALMLRMRMLPNLLTVATCQRPRKGLGHGQTACEPAKEGGGRGGVLKYKVSCDWRFQPPNTSLKLAFMIS